MSNDSLRYYNSESENSTSINVEGMCSHYKTKYYCPVCGREISATTTTCPTCGAVIVDKMQYQSDHVRVVTKISALHPDTLNAGSCTCSICGLKFTSGLSYDSAGVAIPEEVKENHAYRSLDQEIKVGTMPIIDHEIKKLGLNEEYIIPSGYHDGKGKIYTGTLQEYTPANAIPSDILINKTAWVNGVKVVGTLDITPIEQEGTATKDDILYNKTAWVNGVKLTGTIITLPREDKLLQAGEYYTFPKGYSVGTTIISAATLKSQTPGTAKAEDISLGNIAWVEGEKITGTFNLEETIRERFKDTDALASHVVSGKKFYSAKYNQVVNGSMTSHVGEEERILTNGQTFVIPEGYYDGLTKVSVVSLESVTYADAVASNLLAGKTAWVKGVKITGEMPAIPATTTEIEAGGTYTIPLGYHNGLGKVHCAGQEMSGTAKPADILTGKTAWVDGVKITGTMVSNEAKETILLAGETYSIPEGYHTRFGSVTAKDLASQTPATAIMTDIVEGKTAWVNGIKITGSMISVPPVAVVLEPSGRYDIPVGHHDGTGYVQAKSLEEVTKANATPEDLASGKTAWVNGQQIFGTLQFLGNAKPNMVLEGYTFHSDSATLQTGTMPNIPTQYEELNCSESYSIPKGYHDGSGKIVANSLASQTVGDASASDILEGKIAWVNGMKIVGTMKNVNNKEY